MKELVKVFIEFLKYYYHQRSGYDNTEETKKKFKQWIDRLNKLLK